jgi:hypothetical protein
VIPIEVIEANCQITRKFEMLRLVFAYGDMCRVVQEDVGGLKNRIGEETKFEGIFVGCRFERGCIFW